MRLGYRPELDGVRGIAILLVLAFHATLQVGGPIANLQRSWVQGGWAGVELFFVLSGFLITTLLLEERDERGEVALGAFYRRRVMRLVPALAALLVAVVAYRLLVDEDRRQIGGALAAAFYVSNWANIGQVDMGLIEHTWTLAVEGQFYAVWPPLLLLMLERLRPSRVVAVTAGLALLSAGLRVAVWHWTGDWVRTARGTDTQADTLLLGALVGMAFHWRLTERVPRLRRALPYLFVSAFGLFLVASWSAAHWKLYWVVGVLAVCSAVIVLAAVEVPGSRPVRLLGQRDLVWLGQISYSLYLWHVPVVLLIPAEAVADELVVVLRVALSFGLALLSYHAIERPVSRLRHRHGPKLPMVGRQERTVGAA